MKAKETEEEDAKYIQRVVNAYHRVFVGEEWEFVKQDIERRFKTNKPAFGPGQTGMYDPYQAACRDGARTILDHINNVLKQKVQGDANIEEPGIRIIK